jgi:TRAP-type C4-dicarboxylate transport system permease small subunit
MPPEAQGKAGACFGGGICFKGKAKADSTFDKEVGERRMKVFAKFGGRLMHFFFGGVTLYAAYFAGFVILIISGLISYSVVGRYFLHAPLGWSNEVSEYALFFTTFLAAGLVMKEDRHISVDILLTVLPKKARYYLKVTSVLLSTLACALGSFFGASLVYKEFVGNTMTIGVLRFERWWLLAVVPLAFLSMLVILIRRLITRIPSEPEAGHGLG